MSPPRPANPVEPPAPPAVDISSEAVAESAGLLRRDGLSPLTADMLEALAHERDLLRTFVRAARQIVQAYASEYRKHVWQGHEQAMGAYSWLSAEAREIGTARDGGDPKVERT